MTKAYNLNTSLHVGRHNIGTAVIATGTHKGQREQTCERVQQRQFLYSSVSPLNITIVQRYSSSQ